MATTHLGTRTEMGRGLKHSGPHQEYTDPESHLHEVLEKLHHEPTAITADDARRLHEHYEVTDGRSARLISAVEAIATAHDDIPNGEGKAPTLNQVSHASILTLVKDLEAAVSTCPHEVTLEVLKLTQSVTSKMQKAIGSANAPHPELEVELQQEYVRIEPKVEQGTVTKAEADRLHSLEARAHGHTEKGSLTAIAQSVAAKRERQLSVSETSNIGGQDFSASEQLHRGNEVTLERAELVIRPKIDKNPESITRNEASLLDSCEARVHGKVCKGSLAATVQSLADKNFATQATTST